MADRLRDALRRMDKDVLWRVDHASLSEVLDEVAALLRYSQQSEDSAVQMEVKKLIRQCAELKRQLDIAAIASNIRQAESEIRSKQMLVRRSKEELEQLMVVDNA